ncbi:hypothetical protein SE17_09185, partial [Kouleothrix aurantiaca]
MELTGRSAVITGASMGLGRAIAEHFVRAGASVLLVARGAQALDTAQRELAPMATQPGQRVEAVAGNVADAASCAKIIQQAQTLLGDITI